MKRILQGIAALLLVVLVIMVGRTLMIAAPPEQAAAPPIPVDSNAVAQHLAQAVRFQTISYGDGIKKTRRPRRLTPCMIGWSRLFRISTKRQARRNSARAFSSHGSAKTP